MGCQNTLPDHPASWELSGTALGGKRTTRCANHNRQGNQCIREMRLTYNQPVHRCEFEFEFEFESVQIQELTQISIEQWTALPIQQRTRVEIASLVALVDARLEIVEAGIFQLLLNALMSFDEISNTKSDD
jgi:hypothetical protein